MFHVSEINIGIYAGFIFNKTYNNEYARICAFQSQYDSYSLVSQTKRMEYYLCIWEHGCEYYFLHIYVFIIVFSSFHISLSFSYFLLFFFGRCSITLLGFKMVGADIIWPQQMLLQYTIVYYSRRRNSNCNDDYYKWYTTRLFLSLLAIDLVFDVQLWIG